MPKPPPGREPDPMASVVDRLLSQLPGLQGGHDPSPAVAKRPAVPESRGFVSGSGRLVEPPTAIGVWGRVALGIALGVMMAGWPYFKECGLPLFGYLLAVVTVIGAGGWIAVTAWRLRNAVAHVLGLILLFWGIVLTAAELLPRSGYAADVATWQCVVPDSGPSWMRWFAPPGNI